MGDPRVHHNHSHAWLTTRRSYDEGPLALTAKVNALGAKQRKLEEAPDGHLHLRKYDDRRIESQI